jgi:hypothetical protein
MKKYLLLAVIVITSATLYAQDDIVIKGAKKTTKKLTPQQVIDSLNARFPDAKSVQYFTAKPEVVKNGWDITEEGTGHSGDDLDYYTISFKRDDMKYYGLYDKEGNLLKCKMEESVSHLPEPVVTSLKHISKDYPGYKVVSKTFYKNQNYSKSEEYYEVIAKNGEKRKRLYYNADGTLIKMKD